MNGFISESDSAWFVREKEQEAPRVHEYEGHGHTYSGRKIQK